MQEPAQAVLTRAAPVLAVMVALLAVLAPAARAVDGYEFVDWTASDGTTTTGTLAGRPVTLTGIVQGGVYDGSFTTFGGAHWTPPLPQSDVVVPEGLNGHSFTLDLGGPVTDPIIHLYSLASTLAFPGGTSLTKVSGQDSFAVSGNTVSGVALGQDDSSGTIRVSGTFTTLSFSATPTFAGGTIPDGIYLQLGYAIPPAPPPPPPPPDPPPTPPLAEQPIARLSTPGPSVQQYTPARLDASGTTGPVERYDWDVDGDGQTDASCPRVQPILSYRPIGQGATQIALTVVAPSGAHSTDKKTMTVFKPPKRRGARTALVIDPSIPAVGEPTACEALENAGSKVAGGIGKGPPVGCATTVKFRLLAVVGCLDRITSKAQIPDDVRGTVDGLLRLWEAERVRRTYVHVVCNLQRCAKSKEEELIDATDFFVARKTIRMNGLDIEPLGGAALIFHPQLGRIVSSNAAVRVGPATVRKGPLDLDVSPSSLRVQLGSFSTVSGLPLIGNFVPTGELTVALAATRVPFIRKGVYTNPYYEQRSEVTLSLRLPAAFSVFGGRPPVVTTLATATNEEGLKLDELHASAPRIDLGFARLTDVSFDYRRSDPFCGRRAGWQIAARLLFSPEGDEGLHLAPPPERGIGFCGSSLAYAGGRFVFGPPGPPEPEIFPGVSLSEVDIQGRFDPLVLKGSVALKAAKVTKVRGGVLIALATPDQPVTVRAGKGDPLAPFDGTVLQATTVAVGGNVALNVPPFGAIDLGSGYLMYRHPAYVKAGGTIRFEIPGGSVTGSAEGEINATNGRFNLGIGAEICTGFCYGGSGLISSEGIVACGKLSAGPIEWEPGLGWHWDDPFPTIYLAGCDVGDFKAQVASAGVGGSRSFTIPKGVDRMNVRVTGTGGGAPSMTVQAPGGESATSQAAGVAVTRTLRIYRQPGTGVTWIGVANARPGRYTIVPQPGSQAIAEVATAEGLPRASIDAKVEGGGTSRTLRYGIAPQPGQKVTFIERGPSTAQTLGTVTSGTGKLPFEPGPGTTGTRRIVARVERGGLAVEERRVASFSVGRPPGVEAPDEVEVERKGSDVTVKWEKVADAERYGIVVSPAGGAEHVTTASAAQSSTRVTGVDPTQPGRVAVRAIDERGDPGPATVESFPQTKKPLNRFKKFSDL